MSTYPTSCAAANLIRQAGLEQGVTHEDSSLDHVDCRRGQEHSFVVEALVRVTTTAEVHIENLASLFIISPLTSVSTSRE